MLKKRAHNLVASEKVEWTETLRKLEEDIDAAPSLQTGAISEALGAVFAEVYVYRKNL